jgi:DNA-binding response OmpR family regulator
LIDLLERQFLKEVRMPKTVLLVDNHAEFLATWSEYLERADYRVITASDPAEARRLILSGNVHLAIFDKRLVDDEDESDNSGLDLARDPSLRFIPCMILTDFPTHQDVRTALRPGESSAVDFITKENGPKAMLEAVAEAFEKYVPINTDLIFSWEPESGLSTPGILGMFENNITLEELRARSEELEDLLRLLFSEFSEVFILRKLWVDAGRLAFLAHAHHARADRYWIVTLGRLSSIQREIASLKSFPQHPSEGVPSHELFRRRSHYAANAWRLSGEGIEQLETLQEAADKLNQNQLGLAIGRLFQDSLSAWRKQRPPQEYPGSAVDIYHRQYGLFSLDEAQRLFQERVAEIARHARRFNLVQDLVLSDRSLHVRINARQSLHFPDPCQLIFNSIGVPAGSICYTQCSPGQLRFDTILLGEAQAACLTDFAHVDELPVWHDFAFVECELRFTFLDSLELSEIAEIESQLRPSWPEVPRPAVDAPSEMRKYVNAIMKVREQACGLIRQDPQQYAVCLCFNALSELLEAEPPLIRNRRDAARLVHRLLLAGCVAADFFGERTPGAVLSFPPLDIGEDGTVRRGNEFIDVTDTEFRLLAFLNHRPGKYGDRKAICREVFGIPEPGYSQLHGQIDSNLNRLREKLEPDPQNPHYLLTVHGRGIQLVIHPENPQ